MTESTALTTTTSNNQALAFLHDGAALDHRHCVDPLLITAHHG